MAEDQASEASDPFESGSGLRRANAQQARVTRLERLRSSGESSLMGQVVHKACCVCGCDLNHRARFKDGSGKYWCPHCNELDHERTRPTICADCCIEMKRSDMVELAGQGVFLCPACDEKRKKSDSPVQVRTHPRKESDGSAQGSSLPLLPLVFAASAVMVAIVILFLVFR
jgi:hypothetical protein